MTESPRDPRIIVATTALVTSGKRSVEFVIDNISVSGARMVGELTLARGDRVRITFELDGQPLEVDGEVVRVDTPDLMTDQIAVRFVDPSKETRAAIQQLVARSLDLETDSDDDDGE